MTPAWNHRFTHEPARPRWKQPDQRTNMPKCPNVTPMQSLYMNGSRSLRRPVACKPSRNTLAGSCSLEEHWMPRSNGFHERHAEESPVRPRIVTVIRPCGEQHLRKISLLLNRRAVLTFDQLLADVSEALGFPHWTNGRVRRLFTPAGREIHSLSEFFRSDHAFLAFSNGRPALGDLQSAFEELYPDNPGYCGDLLRLWERILRPKAPKADSGFHDDDPLGLTPTGVHHGAQDNKPVANNLQPIRAKEWQSGQGERERVKGSRKKYALQVEVVREKERVKEIERDSLYCRNCKGYGLGSKVRPIPPIGDRHHPLWDGPNTQSSKDPPPQVNPSERQQGVAQCTASVDFTTTALQTKTNGPVSPDNPGEEGLPHELPKQGEELPDFLPDGTELPSDNIERFYDIGRVVGDGNFAVVRECQVRGLAKTFAMKIVDKVKLQGRGHMIQNEIALLRSLAHPRIVRLFRSHHTQSYVYLLMEMVAGGDLFDTIAQNGKFSEPSAAHMIRDVSQALEYIHSRSIAHRDIKPENLLVQHHGDGSISLKLADFGLAMVVTEPVFTVCGTPTYVAPEILAETGYGVQVDIWAMGVILYVLLSGFPPFRSPDRDQEELFRLIQSGEVHFLSPYWEPVSEGAKALVRALLEVDPIARLTACQALQHSWLQDAATDKDQQGETQTSQDQGDTQSPARLVQTKPHPRPTQKPAKTVQPATQKPSQSRKAHTDMPPSHKPVQVRERSFDEPSAQKLVQARYTSKDMPPTQKPVQTRDTSKDTLLTQTPVQVRDVNIKMLPAQKPLQTNDASTHQPPANQSRQQTPEQGPNASTDKHQLQYPLQRKEVSIGPRPTQNPEILDTSIQ